LNCKLRSIKNWFIYKRKIALKIHKNPEKDFLTFVQEQTNIKGLNPIKTATNFTEKNNEIQNNNGLNFFSSLMQEKTKDFTMWEESMNCSFPKSWNLCFNPNSRDLYTILLRNQMEVYLQNLKELSFNNYMNNVMMFDKINQMQKKF